MGNLYFHSVDCCEKSKTLYLDLLYAYSRWYFNFYTDLIVDTKWQTFKQFIYQIPTRGPIEKENVPLSHHKLLVRPLALLSSTICRLLLARSIRWLVQSASRNSLIIGQRSPNRVDRGASHNLEFTTCVHDKERDLNDISQL